MQTIAELEAEMRELSEKCENRGARAEDLDKIRELEYLIEERSGAIEMVQEELRHFETER
jgi:serologically defined colon cancer antigen 8